MKHMTKVFGAIVLVFALTLSFTAVFAEEAQLPENVEYQPSDYIKNIAKNISLFGRYEDLIENNLYLEAIDAMIEKYPELYDVAVKAMVDSVDENSVYYNEEEAKEFFESLLDEVVGIGVTVLEQEGRVVVSQPIPGSPADKAGIRAGDCIRSANGTVLDGMPLDSAVEYIRGKEGTTVVLEVIRSGMPEPLMFTIVRETVITPSVDYELIERDGKKIGRINVYSFTENVAEQFKQALDKAESDGTKNIIIDLRDNGGGYLNQAVQMADMLLPKDKLITKEDHKVEVLNKEYRSTGIGRDFEVVILINEYSASASEVLTAALVENGEAVAIGTKSFGKGTVQAVYDLPKNSVMKLTIAYYLTPEGNNIHKKGITPQAIVENSFEPIDMSQYEVFSLTKKYSIGDKGTEVLNAKKMLSDMGILVGEINDVYDENMKAAVTNYQSATKLYPYGVLDITTQASLYETIKSIEVEVDDQFEAAIDAF